MAAAAPPESKEKKTAKGLWTATLKKAMEYDVWGQSLEAIEEYERLIKLMEAHQRELTTLSIDEKMVMQLTVACMKLRIVNIHDLHGKAGLKAADIKPIPAVLDVMFTGKPLPAFPVHIAEMPAASAAAVTDDEPKTATAAAPAASGSAAGAQAAASKGAVNQKSDEYA